MKSTEALIEDIIQAIESIESYQASSFDAFLDDDKTQDAIMYKTLSSWGKPLIII